MLSDIQIKNICRRELDTEIISTSRMLTGYCHYVYKVITQDSTYILRIAKPELIDLLKGSLYWLTKLRVKNIPVPQIIVNGIDNNPPYLILNYFEGNDLGHIYSTLTPEQKKQIAKELATIQRKVMELPLHKGYGYLKSYDDTDLQPSWYDIVKNHLNRSRQRFEENRYFDISIINKALQINNEFKDYFNAIKPVPFLDDATTKNVIINDGKLEGIVDIDFLCFGDYLLNLGLINTALLTSKSDTDYLEYLVEEYSLTPEQRRVVDLYTMNFCIDFMSEIGMSFNKDEPVAYTKEKTDFYLSLFETVSALLVE